MKRLHLLIGLSALLAALLALGALYSSLPGTVPVHWDSSGNVNGYAARWQLWLFGPGLIGLLLALPWLLAWLSPPQYKLEGFRNTVSYLSMVLTVMMALLFGLVLLAALGHDLMGPRLGWAVLYMLLILIGSPMGKVRRNFFIGIRTPWTLASETVWDATHRLAGWLMVLSGLAGLAMAAAGVGGTLHIVLMTGWAVVAVLYSFILSKREEQQGRL